MPTLEGLAQAAAVNKANTDQSIQNNQIFQRQQAASKAAELFKSGDIKGALSTMAAVDPEHVGQLIQQFQANDPTSQQSINQAKAQGAEQGQFNVTTPYGSNPRQLLDASLAGKQSVAQITSANKPSNKVVKADPNSPSGYTIVDKQAGSYSPVQVPNLPQSKDNMVADAGPGGPEGKPKPNLRPNQDIDSNGQIVTITPGQRKLIESSRKAFDSDTKELVKGLESVDQAKKLIDENVPGFEALEKLRLLRTVSPRPSQQEFQAVGLDMGAINSLENKLSKVGGQGMTPDVQNLYRRVVSVMEKSLTRDYDAKLQNAVGRNPEVDPLILKKHLSSGGPTSIQRLNSAVSSLSPQDQAAFNFAHDNPKDPRAKAIMEHLAPLLK